MPKILTKDASKILDKSPQTVQDYADSGKLKAERTPGGTRLYEEADVRLLKKELDKKKK